MGQKVNPISLRLEKTNRHFDSCWYDDYNYTDLLLRDFKIKSYFKSVLNQIKYPEGRILIENLPKKSNINYFYCNPSNSRRKKNSFFQLQDKVQNKDNKKSFLYKKSVSSFFSEEQKGLQKEKSTLAQQSLEEWKTFYLYSLYTKTVQCEKGVYGPLLSLGNKVEKGLKKQIREQTKKEPEVSHKKKIFYCLSDLIQTRKEKTVYKIQSEKRLVPKPNLTDEQVGKELLYRENKKTTEYSKIKEIMDKKRYYRQPSFPKRDFSAFFRQNKHNPSEISLKEECGKDNTLSPKRVSTLLKGLEYRKCFLLPFSGTHRKGSSILLGHNNINNRSLQFVLKKRRLNNERVENQYTDKKLVHKRFFVRYLLSKLYGEFLQNKSVYSQENLLKSGILTTLSQFRMFFQEKNKKQSIERGDYKKPSSKKSTNTFISNSRFDGKVSTKQDINNEVQRKDNIPKSFTKYKNSFGSKRNKMAGLYSSNLVYKSHLESFLSNQYNSFFNLHLFRTLIEMQGALFLVEEIIYYLERKIPFRRIKSQILKEIPRYKHIKGVRMSCSGRVGGRSKKAQRSKTQSVKIGQTPLGVFSSQIDFFSKSALTRFGLIGVKVWVCYR